LRRTVKLPVEILVTTILGSRHAGIGASPERIEDHVA
jgi:hypothetical protein